MKLDWIFPEIAIAITSMKMESEDCSKLVFKNLLYHQALKKISPTPGEMFQILVQFSANGKYSRFYGILHAVLYTFQT